MNLLRSVRRELDYHANVTLLGSSYLRYQRLRSELKARRAGWWRHDHLSPPLPATYRLKELISRHYLAGRWVSGRRPVAWVTSGAPLEHLKALDYYVHYPENHGAMCGVRRVAVELSTEAEKAGYSRDLCSYVRTDIGSVLSGQSPAGSIPPPDLLVCCTNICQTVMGWYRVLAEHFAVPLVMIDTPFVYDEAGEHALRYVERQLDELRETAERVAGRSLSEKKLRVVLERSRDATELWLEVCRTGRHRPAPLTAFDEFFHMSPIVQMRGDRETVDFYAELLRQLRARVARGEGALLHERKRLLWDNLPVWFRVKALSDTLAENGIALVASTYTNAWGELAPMMDATRPLASLARVYTHPILNRGTGHKLETMREMVADYEADGVILHSDRSCKPYSIGQMDQTDRLRRELGVPALLLEADHNDERSFSEKQTETRLEAFFELLFDSAGEGV